jgi:aldose 1-epimerase
MVKRWFSSLYDTVWRKTLMRSGMLTGLILAVVLLALAVAFQQHTHGNLHKLKEKITTQRQEAPVPHPGGKEAIELMRTRMVQDTVPEFLSATVLPGRGMNVLQIKAYVPGKGDLTLLVSPTVQAAEKVMTGTGADANGQASLTMGGAFEAPWADSISGTPGDGHIAAQWRGHTMVLPEVDPDRVEVEGGLLLAKAATASDTAPLPDGGQATGTFEAQDFGVHWPSKTQVTVAVLLSGRAMELTIRAKNTGDVAEPVGLGWHPQFAIAKANRGEVRLRIPGERRVETRNGNNGMPTGNLLPVTGTSYDFTAREGTKLGSMDLDECFVGLHQSLLDSGPVAELIDPARGYGIRLTALSSAIKAIRVVAPKNGDFVSIQPQFNYPDPLGREWAKTPDTGLVVLQPGQSTKWQVRVELFSMEEGR